MNIGQTMILISFSFVFVCAHAYVVNHESNGCIIKGFVF
jgi:hypothetical protein